MECCFQLHDFDAGPFTDCRFGLRVGLLKGARIRKIAPDFFDSFVQLPQQCCFRPLPEDFKYATVSRHILRPTNSSEGIRSACIEIAQETLAAKGFTMITEADLHENE